MKVFIATHKEFNVPDDKLYQPIVVGGNNVRIPGSIRDDSGDNIAILNNAYCELTALYWMWKNSKEDIIGLVHYRRYFEVGNNIINEKQVEKIMRSYDIIIPKKRNYYITTIKEHYAKAHYAKDFELTRAVVNSKCPEYIESFDFVMNGRSLSLYNMFIAKKNIIDRYCSWLFPIINELYKNIDLDKYSSYQKRVIGFLSERLFNVWVFHNFGKDRVFFLNVKNTEGEPKFKKIIMLLKRHYLKEEFK